jgi:hypothetical protein
MQRPKPTIILPNQKHGNLTKQVQQIKPGSAQYKKYYSIFLILPKIMINILSILYVQYFQRKII